MTPVDVQVRNLSVQVESSTRQWKDRFPSFRKSTSDLETPQTKCLLTHIDADFPHGTLTGILGSRGSGKTTLLNVLSERMYDSNLSVQGERLHNNSTSLSSISHAYVGQTDSLLPTVTVHETLTFAASLLLPTSISRIQRAKLVDNIIVELGLKDCSNSCVGDGVRHMGCSSGGLRLISLGIELLRNPSVLFLEEPTTGLDPTIIMTLHQPRSDVFRMLDRVILLSQGHSLYAGVASEAVPWFERLVRPLELHRNPADYLIDIGAINVCMGAAEETAPSRISRLIAAWKSESAIRFPPLKSKLTISPVDPHDVIKAACWSCHTWTYPDIPEAEGKQS